MRIDPNSFLSLLIGVVFLLPVLLLLGSGIAASRSDGICATIRGRLGGAIAGGNCSSGEW